MKITVDRVKCTGHGICEQFAPDVFEINDDGDLVLLSDEVAEDLAGDVREAVDRCPTLALRLED
jgi:ferredoxin